MIEKLETDTIYAGINCPCPICTNVWAVNKLYTAANRIKVSIPKK